MVALHSVGIGGSSWTDGDKDPVFSWAAANICGACFSLARIQTCGVNRIHGWAAGLPYQTNASTGLLRMVF